MWFRALTILPVLIGTSVNATPHENIKNIKQPTIKSSLYVENFSLQTQLINHSAQYSTDNDTNYDVLSQKDELQAQNTALMVKEYQYCQSLLTYRNNGLQKVYIPTSTGVQGYTTALLMYQITPYENLVNVEENITMYMALDIVAGLQEINMDLTIHVLNSVEQNWVNYLDLSTYYVSKTNYNVYNSLTDSANGFMYNESIYTKHYEYSNRTNESVQQALEFNMQLVNNKTNYVAIYIEPTFNQEGPTYVDPELVSGAIFAGQGNYRSYAGWLIFTNPTGENTTISGQMLMGTQTTEVIDVPGLMFYILTMPFTFISVAFNLTLFEGTPYQINISNLFLSIIAIFVFIFLISLLIKRGLK